MSSLTDGDLKSRTQQFKRDFIDWTWLLKEDGETDDGIEEIRQQIRDDWHDDEKRELWMAMVAERAEFRRELIAMANGINERVKRVENAN